MYELGVRTSNSSEQASSFLETERELPICDIFTQLTSEMSYYSFRRSHKAISDQQWAHKLTSTALTAHPSVVLRFNTLLYAPEEVVVDRRFSCVVRRSPDKAVYSVRVTPSYKVECLYRHCEKMLRPCDHAIAKSRRLRRWWGTRSTRMLLHLTAHRASL